MFCPMNSNDMVKVQEIYQKLREQGYTAKEAAKEAQAQTGDSVVTGKPINRPDKKTQVKWMFGEYNG